MGGLSNCSKDGPEEPHPAVFGGFAKYPHCGQHGLGEFLQIFEDSFNDHDSLGRDFYRDFYRGVGVAPREGVDAAPRNEESTFNIGVGAAPRKGVENRPKRRRGGLRPRLRGQPVSRWRGGQEKVCQGRSS